MVVIFFAAILCFPYITRLLFIKSLQRVGGLWVEKVRLLLPIENLQDQYILITGTDWL